MKGLLFHKTQEPCVTFLWESTHLSSKHCIIKADKMLIKKKKKTRAHSQIKEVYLPTHIRSY